MKGGAMITLTNEEFMEIINELEDCTNYTHSEYCISGSCSCRFDLIKKYRLLLENAPQEVGSCTR
jgi:hypothetical protein